MRFALGFLALGLLLIAPVASASADSWSGPVSYADHRDVAQNEMKGPRHYGSARCRSEADDKGTALEFCEDQLKCSQQTPPMTTSCSGSPGRWVCVCK
jgi:hypothetical protein